MANHYGDFKGEISGSLEAYPISYSGSGLFNMTELAEEMANLLPSYYFLGNNVRRIMELIAVVLEEYQDRIDQVRDQFFVGTATWGLKFWEELVGLPISENLTDEERRALIINKLRNCSSEKCFVEGLEAIVNGAVIITLLDPATNPYQIDIELRSADVVYPGPRTAPVPSTYGAGVLTGDYTYKVTYGFEEVFVPNYIVTNPDAHAETNSGVSPIRTNEKQGIYADLINEVQLLTITGAGTFDLTFDGATTTPLNETSTAQDVVNALNALSPSGTYGGFGVSTTSPVLTPVTSGVTIVFDTLGVVGANIPPLAVTNRTGTIGVVGVNAVQKVSTNGTGTFELVFAGATTAAVLTESSTANDVVVALNALSPIVPYGAFTVSTPSPLDTVGGGGVTIVFDGGGVGYEPVPLLQFATAVGVVGTVEDITSGGNTIEVTRGGRVTGGTFTIIYDNIWDSTLLVDEEQTVEVAGTGQFLLGFDGFGEYEIQSISTTNTPILNGDYTLTVDDGAGGTVTTADIPYNANAAAIQAAINAATPAGADVVVTETTTAAPFGLGAPSNKITITYTGADFAFDSLVQVTVAAGSTPPAAPVIGGETIVTDFEPLILTDASTGAQVEAAINNLAPTTANTYGEFFVTTTTPLAVVGVDPVNIVFDGDGVRHTDVPLLEVVRSNGTISGTIVEQVKGLVQPSQLPNPRITDPLPYNATAQQVYDALTALPNVYPGTLRVTGGPVNQYPILVEWIGYEGGFPQAMLEVDGLMLTGGGSYQTTRLTSGDTTYGDSESITVTAVNNSILLNNVPISPDGAVVRNIYRKRVDLTPPTYNTVNVGTPYNEYRYVGSIDNNFITAFLDNVPDSEVSEVQLVELSGSTGAFKLRYDGKDTTNLTSASTALDVKTALDNLTSSLGYTLAVNVTGNFTNGYKVYFDGGDVIGCDVPQMAVIPVSGGDITGIVTTVGPRVLTEQNSAFTYTLQRAIDYIYNTKPAHLHVRELRSAAFRASINRAGDPV